LLRVRRGVASEHTTLSQYVSPELFHGCKEFFRIINSAWNATHFKNTIVIIHFTQYRLDDVRYLFVNLLYYCNVTSRIRHRQRVGLAPEHPFADNWTPRAEAIIIDRYRLRVLPKNDRQALVVSADLDEPGLLGRAHPKAHRLCQVENFLRANGGHRRKRPTVN